MSVAEQDAATVLVAAVGVHVTALESVLDPFLNCIVPVGPTPLLFVVTFAVKVMLPPDATLLALGATCVSVAALVTVSASATVAAAL